ncbi:DNA-binding GntR family transcriptional regulator [Kribbella orskensis]|uniref:DNA-binding GntR family transcriptional regulator n=1 Tax=Kribbella orskensis TaxID=2512216 RepID=A0ABY2BI47_9ACTN|nr:MULTISPECIES: GntR family transcriptional regulator [Kribbella]TCN38296.1 DNA-binding GntR family transcriptional regulator [Kribbella sp. VKM Ac-2500]TCO20174.1 DNA-binding GntR family transcriptional regulator [Kribbella orskensis]
MPDAGRPKSPLSLSAAERAALNHLATGTAASPAMRQRARIVLVCAEGRSNKDVADALAVTPGTVGKWRRRFLRMGMAGLDDGMRSGRPRMVDRVRLGAVTAGSMAGSGQAAQPTGRSAADGSSARPRARSTDQGIGDEADERLPPTREVAAAYGVSQSTVVRRRREERLGYRSGGGLALRSTQPVPAQTTENELLSERVYEAIRGWILSGELAPGMRVVESEIARVLGTSQTPAREAVRRLAHEGLVTYQPRLGNFVTEISQVEAREAREVRVLLESAAARRATGRVPEHELDLLRTEVRLMTEAAEHHDIGAFREADLRFHRQVLATSGNSMLLRVWRTLEPALWSLQVVSNAMYAGDWGLMARRHLDLVLALAGNDPEDAVRLFAAHARGESSITRPAVRHD